MQLTTNQVNFNGNAADHGEADRVYLVKSLTVNYSHHGKHRFTKEHVIVNYTWFLLLVTVTNDAKKKLIKDKMQNCSRTKRTRCKVKTIGCACIQDLNSYCSIPLQYQKTQIEFGVSNMSLR